MLPIGLSIFACLGAFFWLLWLLRRDRISLGLPIAYLFALLLIHVPGAIAHLVAGDILPDSDLTELGIRFTAIGSLCFVAGVWLANSTKIKEATHAVARPRQFWLFCLFGGWFFTYGLAFLARIPSVGAAVENGGAVWMLGVMLGLRAALHRRDFLSVAFWLGTLMVYPVLVLLLGGFLSYGSTAVIIVLSLLTVSTRSPWRAAAGITIVAVVGFNLFLSWHQHRSEIRDAVWGGASLERRIDASMNMVRDFQLFSPVNEGHLRSLDARLNQNYFVGLAAWRLQNDRVDYLYGRSVAEGFMALVPRIVWSEKPVFGGSPEIVSEMTGLNLNRSTSWGVGNVMEFQINFGLPGVVFGFLLLGWLLRTLDRKAAEADATGDFGRVILFFLPAAALIEPAGSVVELVGGSAAAVVAAFSWRWVWHRLSLGFADRRALASPQVAR